MPQRLFDARFALHRAIGNFLGPFVPSGLLRSRKMAGERLWHCVASYSVKCVTGESSLYSLRDAAGNPLSTFEVVLTASRPTLVQHRGADNDEPPEPERRVAQHFVAEGLGRLAPERVAAVRRARRGIGAPVAQRLLAPNALVDEVDPAAARQLADAIAFAHPPEARRAGLVAYVRRHRGALLSAVAGG